MTMLGVRYWEFDGKRASLVHSITVCGEITSMCLCK
jgi:hypothetical protein